MVLLLFNIGGIIRVSKKAGMWEVMATVRTRNTDHWRVILGIRINKDLKSQLPGLARALGYKNQSRLVEVLIEQAIRDWATPADTLAQKGAVWEDGIDGG